MLEPTCSVKYRKPIVLEQETRTLVQVGFSILIMGLWHNKFSLMTPDFLISCKKSSILFLITLPYVYSIQYRTPTKK